MTIPEALAVLFDVGLPMLEDNARDLATQDDAWREAPSQHPLVLQCKAAIAVLREAKDAGAVMVVEKQ